MIIPYNSMLELAFDIDPTCFITHNFGYEIKPLDGERRLKHFYNMADRAVLGRNWNKKPPDQRIRAIGYWEHLETNPHLHALVSASVEHLEWIEGYGPKAWMKCNQRGQLDTGPIRDLTRAVRYAFKEAKRGFDSDRLFVYAPQRSQSEACANERSSSPCP